MQLSEEAKTNLMKVVEKSANILSESIDSSGKLVKENAKELVSEVLIYEGIVNNIFNLIGATVAGVLVKIGFNFLSTAPVETVSASTNVFLTVVLSIVGFGIFIWGVSSIQDMLKAKLAPRLFLISYAMGLVKSNSDSSSTTSSK